MTERKIDFMKTDLFHIGKFVIHGYGLMIGIGFVLALLVGEYRAKKMGMKEEALIDIAIIAGVSGFLGAKLLYIIVSFKDFIKDPIGVLKDEEGLANMRNLGENMAYLLKALNSQKGTVK